MRRLEASRGAALTAAVVILSAMSLHAQMPAPPAAMAALVQDEPEPEFLNLRMAGRDVSRGVRKVLTEMVWHRDLAAAAVVAKQQQRPILWLQMLGNLHGFT